MTSSAPTTSTEILALPRPVRTATEVRSTLLVSSLLAVRETGREGPYFEALDAEWIEAMRSISPGIWVPIAQAVAHYRAVDRLGLTAREAHENGVRVAERLQAGVVGTVLRGLRSTGVVTPAHLVPRAHMFWSRSVIGGGLRADRLGERRVRLEVHAMPTMAFPYARAGFGGVMEGTLQLVTKTVRVEVVEGGDDFCAYHIER